jgi:uncharacterized protein YqeY
MTLEERIMADLKEAMKKKDQAALRGIRAIKAAILLAKTESKGVILDDAKEVKILQKLVKQRQDSYSIYKEQGRGDLAEVESEEIAVIQRYLPEQLSEEELGKIVEGIIADTGAESMKDMGKVMGIASKKLGGKADGKTIANMVKNKLNNA